MSVAQSLAPYGAEAEVETSALARVRWHYRPFNEVLEFGGDRSCSPQAGTDYGGPTALVARSAVVDGYARKSRSTGGRVAR
jgi:hypothetical protein